MTEGTVGEVGRELIERYWACARARDWSGFGALLHPEVVYEVPQTRERVRGREAYVEFNATWPDDWDADVLEVIANGERGFSRIAFYPNRLDRSQVQHGLCVFGFRDGLIAHLLDYWPEPYEPPARHGGSVERY